MTLPPPASAPADSDLSTKSFRWGLFGLFCLHLLVITLYSSGVIPQHYRPKGGFMLLHHGGDEGLYFKQSLMLLSGKFAPAIYPFGFPLLLAPFAAFLRNAPLTTTMSIVSLFWGVALFPIGQWLLASTTVKITGSRKLALLTVGIWTLLPLVLYLYLLTINATVAETWSSHLMWLQMLSEGPSVLFTLLAFWLLTKGPKEGREPTWALGLGALAGFAVLIRLTGVVTLGAVGLLLLFQRRVRAAVITGAAAICVITPQLIYNARFLGGPLKTGYEHVSSSAAPGAVFGPGQFVTRLNTQGARAGIWWVLAALPVFALAIVGFRFIWKRNRIGGLTLAVWVGGYLSVYAMYSYTWLHLGVYLMPLYPAMAVLSAAGLWSLAQRSRLLGQAISESASAARPFISKSARRS